MSSRKSSRSSSRGSSRGSSRSSRKSSNNKAMDLNNIQTAINTEITKENKNSIAPKIPGFIFTLALYGTILYYLYNLEDADCNCIRDWRHNFIKAMCLVIIFLSFIGLFGFNIKSNSFKWLTIIYFVLFDLILYIIWKIKKQPSN